MAKFSKDETVLCLQYGGVLGTVEGALLGYGSSMVYCVRLHEPLVTASITSRRLYCYEHELESAVAVIDG